QSELFENIIAGEYSYEEEYWKDISPLAKNFIDSLLVRPAERRSTATQALAHPWFRAMLDHDLSVPSSPTESVNLLPSVSKNFNARGVFKKAVKAVGLLKKIHGAQYQNFVQARRQQELTTAAAIATAEGSSSHGNASPTAEVQQTRIQEQKLKPEEVIVTAGVNGPNPNANNHGLSFHDVVGVAVLAKHGVHVDVAISDGPASHIRDSDDSERCLQYASTALEELA
ncbi:PDZ domain-containing protein 4, partial [Lobosporangium transversale]